MTLPNFLVIGAYKAGTTSLQWYLAHHPDVFVSAVKEPRFFAFDGLDGDAAAEAERTNPMYTGAVHDLASYEALFDDVDGERAIGEVSPEYLKNPHAVDRIAEHVPDVRLVAVLRNPVQRAFSDYLMYRRDGREHEPDFLAALTAQDERLARGDATGQYLVTGNYADQLAPYYERFGAEHILVILNDDLIAERDATMARVFDFLGVDPSVSVAPLAEMNRSGVFTNPVARNLYALRRKLAPLVRGVVPPSLKRRIDNRFEAQLTKPELDPAAEAWLHEHYAAQIERTAALTGLDLVTRWSSPSASPLGAA